ncbi:MAG: sialate O-acetylesterase [Planctomycetaceae bacterium]
MTRSCLFAFLVISSPALGDVHLPKVVGSHMVLQRNTDVRFWGEATPGESVEVTPDWLKAPVRTAADAAGRWEVSIATGEAGGPHSMTIKGENTIILHDILFGEVWIASGQSNMEMPLVHVSGAYTGIQDAEQEVANANYPQIRLFQTGNFSSKDPLDDVERGIEMYGIPPAKCQWQPCSPETVPTFSSTAYFFARELHRQLGVPIGVIDSSWGGTPAEAWTPEAGLKELEFVAELEQAATLPQQPDQKVPTRLYNGMIHPLRNYTINGAIWYQGEGNAGRANDYRRLFSTMIGQWRQAFGSEFSFYFVQIAPFNYQNLNAALLREAQLETLSVPGTGMAVTMDIGNLTDIHPKNKQEVGRRLALWALAKDYGKGVAYSGPLFQELSVEGSQVRLRFNHADGGLATRDGEAPTHFEVAGEDQVFHPAAAAIDGDEIIVSSVQVTAPQAVRYAFTSDAQPNLTNKAGLPASSFRTDRW